MSPAFRHVHLIPAFKHHAWRRNVHQPPYPALPTALYDILRTGHIHSLEIAFGSPWRGKCARMNDRFHPLAGGEYLFLIAQIAAYNFYSLCFQTGRIVQDYAPKPVQNRPAPAKFVPHAHPKTPFRPLPTRARLVPSLLLSCSPRSANFLPECHRCVKICLHSQENFLNADFVEGSGENGVIPADACASIIIA